MVYDVGKFTVGERIPVPAPRAAGGGQNGTPVYGIITAVSDTEITVSFAAIVR